MEDSVIKEAVKSGALIKGSGSAHYATKDFNLTLNKENRTKFLIFVELIHFSLNKENRTKFLIFVEIIHFSTQKATKV